MTGKRRLTKSLNTLDTIKQNNPIEFPGILGAQFKGQTLVDVPNREGYVYVRLRSNLNEVLQAYNSEVSPVYGLPVIVVRDATGNRYIVKGRDLGMYGNWGTSAYVPRHGAQHSFPDNGWGGDIVWVYGRQFTPLCVTPATGSSGGNYVFVNPYIYYLDRNWDYAGGVATPNLLGYKPTNNEAKLILVYLDGSGIVQTLEGSNFPATDTTYDLIIPHLPSLPNGSCVPLGAVRLTSGTSIISWNEIFDLRPLVDWWSGSGSSGGGGATTLDELTDVDAASPNNGDVLMWDDGASEWINSPITTGSSSTEIRIPIDGFGKGAAKPTETVLGNWFGYAFSINDLGYFSFEVPEDWDGTSDIDLALHYYIDEAYSTHSGSVRFAAIRTIITEDGTETVDGSTATINGDDKTIPITAKALDEYEIEIPAATLALHDVIGFQLKRVALSAGANPTAEPVIVGMEGEYKRAALVGTPGIGVRQTIFTFPGALTVSYSPLRVYNKLGTAQTISQVFLSAGTAPVGDDVIVDIHKDGTTIFTNQAHRPLILDGANSGNTTTIDVAGWADGEYLVAYVDQIGTGTAGSDLVVHVIHS
jgi:hypothetical protein